MMQPDETIIIILQEQQKNKKKKQVANSSVAHHRLIYMEQTERLHSIKISLLASLLFEARVIRPAGSYPDRQTWAFPGVT